MLPFFFFSFWYHDRFLKVKGTFIFKQTSGLTWVKTKQKKVTPVWPQPDCEIKDPVSKPLRCSLPQLSFRAEAYVRHG